MLSLKIVACLAGACVGQADKKDPAPDRFVSVKVQEATLPPPVHKDFRQVKQTQLLIDRINFGYQFHQPNDPQALGHPDKDFCRFAGCYFHPQGPAGIGRVTERPLSAQPNAGKPRNFEGRNLYLSSPEYMASYAKRFVRAGVRPYGQFHIAILHASQQMLGQRVPQANVDFGIQAPVAGHHPGNQRARHELRRRLLPAPRRLRLR